jgi:hypothetical protein
MYIYIIIIDSMYKKIYKKYTSPNEDQSDVRSNSTMINQTNAIDSIGCLINWSNILGSIRSSIDPMIIS